MDYTLKFLTFIVCAYVLLCIILGFKDTSKIKTLKEFALGYKNISTAVLVATMYATHMGAGSTIGFIEAVNNVGVAYIVVIFGYQFNWYLTKAIYSRNLDRFKGCISQAHIMHRLYGDFGFLTANILNVFSSIIAVSMQIMAISFVTQYFFNVSPFWAIFIGASVVTAYAASGGVKAVILTDVVQFLLFVAIIITAFLLVSKSVSNAEDWFVSIPQSKLWVIPYDTHSMLLICGMLVCSSIPIGQHTPFIQRILISGLDDQVRKVFLYFRYIDLIAVLGVTVIGIFLLKSTGEGVIDKAGIFKMIHSSANPLIIAAAVTGILAVTMSTADSWLNAGSVIVTDAIVKYLNPKMSDINQVRTARLITVCLGFIGACVAFFGKSVMSLMLIGYCFIDPMFCVPLAAGFLGYNCTTNDYKRAIITALISVFIGRFIEGDFGFIALSFGIIGSAIGLALPYKWTFKLPDGTSMIALPKLNPLQPMFLVLVLGICFMHCLLNSYISNEWMHGEVLLSITCIISSIIALSLKMYEYKKQFDYSVYLSATTLVAAITAFVFKMNLVNTISNIYLCLAIFILLAHRLKYSVIIGLLIGALLSYALPGVALYSPNIPTIMLLLAFLALAGFYLLIYNELNITKSELAITKLKETAITDPMTGFYNMGYDIKSLFERYKEKAISVIAIDIDKFKRFNDEYQSHDVGDDVLKSIAEVMKECLRKDDVCIRRGGDEFIIILPNTLIDQASIIAERIALSIKQKDIVITKPPYKTRCTISYGFDALAPQDKKIWDVVERADNKLYKSKGLMFKVMQGHLESVNT